MYCLKQPSEGALQNSCSALVVNNPEKYDLGTSIFKYLYCQYLKQTKGWPYLKSLKN